MKDRLILYFGLIFLTFLKIILFFALLVITVILMPVFMFIKKNLLFIVLMNYITL